MADSNSREPIVPQGMEPFYDNWHFAPATRAGNMIWVSGQVGVDRDMVPGKDIAAQAELAFASLKFVLEAAGATMSDIVEITTFHTDLRGEMEAFVAAKDQFLPDNHPSWTAVGVTQLALPELKVEIRAVAIAGCGPR